MVAHRNSYANVKFQKPDVANLLYHIASSKPFKIWRIEQGSILTIGRTNLGPNVEPDINHHTGL